MSQEAPAGSGHRAHGWLGYTEAQILSVHLGTAQEQHAFRSEDEGGVERGAVCYLESSGEAAWDE